MPRALSCNPYFFKSISAMALITRIKLKHENKVRIVILNLNNDDSEDVNKFKSILHIERVSSLLIKPDKNERVKELLDYIAVIERFHRLKCNYTLLVEDDAIAALDWFESINDVLSNHLLNENNWIFVKLFTGYKLYDWDWLMYPEAILRVIFFSIVFGTFQVFLIKNKIKAKIWKLIVIILIYLNSLLLISWLNTTSIHPVRSGLRTYNSGFGCVAVLYPRQILENNKLVDYFKSTLENYISGRVNFFEPKDLLLDRFKKANNLTEYTIEPSVFQHIGMHSSLYARDASRNGFKTMFKSNSFIHTNELIHFNPIKFLS